MDDKQTVFVFCSEGGLAALANAQPQKELAELKLQYIALPSQDVISNKEAPLYIQQFQGKNV